MPSKSLEEEIKRLTEALLNEQNKNSLLSEELVIYTMAVEKLVRQLHFEKYMNTYGRSATVSAAYHLLLEPTPIKLICSGSKADTSEAFLVGVADILAIQSKRRLKEIFLKNPVRPISGGKEKLKLLIDNNKMNFETLLFRIQKRDNHLLRVNKSFAINIYHYNFELKKTFVLKSKFKNLHTKEIDIIKIDSCFNATIYHERMEEITRILQHYHEELINSRQGPLVKARLLEIGYLEE